LGTGRKARGGTEKAILGTPYSCTITDSSPIRPGAAAIVFATSRCSITTSEAGLGWAVKNFRTIRLAA